MPRLIHLEKMPTRKRRPSPSKLPPWQPGKSGRAVLQYLHRYRYLTSELAGLLYEAEHGRGRYQARQELGKLWKYGYVERFFRPADWGSNQYVYTLSVEGAHVVVDPADWPEERRRIYNLAKKKADYEHALATSLIQILWNLGAPSQDATFVTVTDWADKAGRKDKVINEFVAQVGREGVRVQPDLTYLIAHRRRGYYRPYFFEIERTHKNYDRLRRRFLAYAHLLGVGGEEVVQSVFERETGLVPARGMAVFVLADDRQAARMRDLALTVVKPNVEMWFTSLERLLERRPRHRRDGSPCYRTDPKSGERVPLMEELPIEPERFFTDELLVALDGKRGRLVV